MEDLVASGSYGVRRRCSVRGLSLSCGSMTLSIGARVGLEVAALWLIGVEDSVGINLVPRPPLVVKGDFHAQPFDAETFVFEYSNVFVHALYPEKLVGEIERALKPGGVCVIHVSLHGKTVMFSANVWYCVKPLVNMSK